MSVQRSNRSKYDAIYGDLFDSITASNGSVAWSVNRSPWSMKELSIDASLNKQSMIDFGSISRKSLFIISLFHLMINFDLLKANLKCLSSKTKTNWRRNC